MTHLRTNMIGRFMAGLLSLAASYGAFAGPGEGQAIYESFCTVCHGGLGGGETMGKSLVDTTAKDLSDAALIETIRNGRAGTGMAAYGDSFSAQEIRDLAGYVRVLQGGVGLASEEGSDEASSTPAILAGEALFNGAAGCVDCHSYAERGGRIGPALDDLASRLSPDEIRQAVLTPSQAILPEYGVKEIRTMDRKTVRGRYRNDTQGSIQILSKNGRLWTTYFKESLRSARDVDESLMPDTFAQLNPDDQEALLAFLNSL